MNSRIRTLLLAVTLCTLVASFTMAAAASAAAPAVKRVVPVWAGIKHGKPVKGGVVTVRSRKGALLAPAERTDRIGATTLVARRALPKSFVVEVRRAVRKRGKGRKRAKPRKRGALVLRATVRDWKGTRVVYVNPYSTIVDRYMKRHPKLSAAKATARVQRHLGIGPRAHRPEAGTFRSSRAFDAKRFASLAAKRGGVLAYARRVARDVDGPVRPKRFRPKSQRRGKGKARGSATTTATGGSTDLNASRVATERELLDAAQAAMALATGSPSALLQIGKLLDSLLGGGDTAELRQIATQLASIQTGIDDLEHQVSQVDTEVSLAAYSSAVQAYGGRQATIDTLWDQYTHVAQYVGTGDTDNATQEIQALSDNLAGWDNVIQSSYAVPYNNNAPGLMAWAQNSFAKNHFNGVLTADDQSAVRVAGFQWWSYWAKDIVLHGEKWADRATAGPTTPADAGSMTTAANSGLTAARQNGYGTDLPQTVVYSINTGKLYSVGTTWNIKPTVTPPAAGEPDWGLMTKEAAAALPSNSVTLTNALFASVPSAGSNPNSSMSNVLGAKPNNGTAPTFAGTGGGYGTPPVNTHTFALDASTNGGCVGQWQYYENGQGSSNTTGAPIIEFCPALNVLDQSIVASTCAQVLSPGQFFGWSDTFPLANWNGLWRREKAIQFTTCTDYDTWQNASQTDASLNWGTGLFSGSKPLSRALAVSNAPSAYYGLWTRPVSQSDSFLVGPVVNTN